MTFGGSSLLPPSLIPSLVPCSISLYSPSVPLGRTPLQRRIGTVHLGLCIKRTITTETYFFQLSKIAEFLFKETKILSETNTLKNSLKTEIISEIFQRDTEQLSSWSLFLFMIVKGWRRDLVVTPKPWVCIKLFTVPFAGLYIPTAWYSEACLNHFQYIYLLGTQNSHGGVWCVFWWRCNPTQIEIYNKNWEAILMWCEHISNTVYLIDLTTIHPKSRTC